MEGHPSRRAHHSRTVVIVIDDKFSLLEFSCCIEVFTVSNRIKRKYKIIQASPQGGSIGSGSAGSVETEALATVNPGKKDIVIVLGGDGASSVPQSAIADWLRERAGRSRLCGIGAGTDLLTRSLDLDPTVPAPDADLHPRSNRQLPIIAERRGPVWMCSGKTTALDMMLALVAEDWGVPHALHVAEALLMYVWRRPDEPALSMIFELQKRGRARFSALHDYIRTNLAEDLRVERLAELCRMTPRTFARHFLEQTGTTPASAVASIRLEAARILINSRASTLTEIAHVTGFGSELSLRRAYLRAFGALPSNARHRGRDGRKNAASPPT